MSKVLGKNVGVYTFIGGQWLLYGCAMSCNLDVQTDFIETTFLNSGKYRDFVPTVNSFSGEISGLVNLEEPNLLSLPDLRQKQLSHEKLLMRFQREDLVGNIYSDQCYFFISSSKDDASFDGINSFSISLRGTGAITQVFTPITIGGSKVTRLQFTLPANVTTVTRPELVGKDVLEVVRDGIGNSKIVITGSPTFKEVLFDVATGDLTWAIPSADDGTEECYVLYQNL